MHHFTTPWCHEGGGKTKGGTEEGTRRTCPTQLFQVWTTPCGEQISQLFTVIICYYYPLSAIIGPLAFGMTPFVRWLKHLPVDIQRFHARYCGKSRPDRTAAKTTILLWFTTLAIKLLHSYLMLSGLSLGSPYFGAYHSFNHTHTYPHIHISVESIIMSNMSSSTND